MSDGNRSGLRMVVGAICVAMAAPGLAAEKPAAKARQEAMKDFEILDESFRKVLSADSAVAAICTGHAFTEGPVWMKELKCLLFSDIPADTIYRWSQEKGKSVFRKPSHNTNGNIVDGRGRLISCEHGSRTVTRTEAGGEVRTIASACGGKKFNSPNDAAVKSDGTIWFTDPPYGLKNRPREQPANYVFRLDKAAAEPVIVASDFDRPNGLCFSPDEKYLYIADSGKPHHVRRLEVLEGNRLGKGKVFAVIAPGVPDGMRVDAAGRLYATAGDGVQVFDPSGKPIGKIKTAKGAANCCFGGPDRKTLFITARDTVWAVRLAVAGN